MQCVRLSSGQARVRRLSLCRLTDGKRRSKDRYLILLAHVASACHVSAELRREDLVKLLVSAIFDFSLPPYRGGTCVGDPIGISPASSYLTLILL